MRGADLGQRIDTVDYRLELFAEYELQNLVQFAHRSHERPQEAVLLAEQVTKVDSRIVPGGRAARDEPSAGSERLDALLPCRDSHVLDDHVHATLPRDALHLAG